MSVAGESGTAVAISLPHSAASDERSKLLLYRITINHTFYSPSEWRIIVDDCIKEFKINGQPVDLSRAKGNACDWRTGITLNLSDYLKRGANTLEIKAEDVGGLYGLKIAPVVSPLKLLPTLGEIHPTLPLLFNGLVAFALIVYFCRFLRKQGVEYLSISLFILSAVVSLHYLHISNNDAYTNDVGWHLGYINYVLHNWLTPYAYSTITSNHPPLYYYVAAGALYLNELFIGLPDNTMLRFVSWGFFLIFHSFNLLTLRRAGFSGIGYYACAALLLLWPGNAHYASKINSEAMYYAITAISFYYTVSWHQDNKQHQLMSAIIFAGIAMMIRISAVISFATIGALVLVALCRRRVSIRDFFSSQWVGTTAILAGCFLVAFGGIIYYGGNTSVFEAMVDKSGRPFFPFTYFLSLNYSLDKPFNDWNTDGDGFIAYILRTSVFGEYVWTSPDIAVAMGCFLVAIFWYALLPWLFVNRAQWQGLLPYALNLLCSLGFLVYFLRLTNTLAAQDARYIYPALICFVVFFGKSHAIYTQRGMWLPGWLGPLLVIGFTALSTYFFWNNFR